MSRRVLAGGRLLEEWDDQAGLYRAWSVTGVMSQRPYTSQEEAAAAGRRAGSLPPLRPVTARPAGASPGHTVLSAAPSDLHIGGERRVVLTASLPWEVGVVQEPSVWHANGHWHMLYTGGWTSSAIGYAAARAPQGPWSKSLTPVIGNGHGGMPTTTSHHSVHVEDGTVYAYYPTVNDGGQLMVATASILAPTEFTTRGVALTPGGGAAGVVNTSLAKRGPGDYVLMFEARSAAQQWPQWQTGYATGPGPLGPFTVRRFPLPSLSRGDSSAMYGGPCLLGEGDGWTLLYHASPTLNLPTELWRATSTDLESWHPDPEPWARMVLPVEVDQVSDPVLVANPAGGPAYAFWSAMNNNTPSGAIVMSVPRAVVTQFDGTQWARIL